LSFPTSLACGSLRGRFAPLSFPTSLACGSLRGRFAPLPFPTSLARSGISFWNRELGCSEATRTQRGRQAAGSAAECAAQIQAA
jgi:CRISPR/Cas system endoribonuclease Cas6 (RAMP superfamily)